MGTRRRMRSLALAALWTVLLPAPSALAAAPAAPASAPSPVYTLPIHAVVVTDGTYSPAISAAEIQQWVDFANTVYDDAGVQFYFDSANPDLSNLTNANLSHVSGDGDSFWAQVLVDGNAEAAKNPGKVTVFFRYGPIDPDPAKIAPTGGGFSDDSYNFIVMPGFQVTTVCGHQNIGVLAHEAGHYLGLAHTFALDPFVYNTQPKLEKFYNDHGKKADVFDGDGLADTDPDPFSWEIQCDPSITTVAYSGHTFNLPRHSIMSYYDAADSLTQDQIAVVRQTIESNVHNLFPSDPAIHPAVEISGPGPNSTTYDSPDIWIDSPFNGYDIYAAWQSLDSEGVPQGTGDPFWQGKLNYIRYRIRNLGTAAATNVKVEISLTQPATVATACGGKKPGTEKILATQTIGVLEPGQTLRGKVPWVPQGSAPALIRVRLLDTPFELSKANNLSQETLGVAYVPPGSLGVGSLANQTLILAIANPCDTLKPIRVKPVGLPHKWEVTLEPSEFLLEPGETQIVKVHLTPPADAAPGAFVGIRLGVYAPSGDFSPLLGEVNLTGQVAQPMAWACEPPTSASVGSPIVVRGRASPAVAGLPLWLEYVRPDGTSESHAAITDGQGAFADRFSPTHEGPWTVQVYSEGDLAHQPGRSRPCGFRVEPAAAPQPSAAGFDHRFSATEIFYRGAGCGPKELELRAAFEGGPATSIVAFYRLRTDGGTTAWNEGVAMAPAGDGWFALKLLSDTIPGAHDSPHSQLEIQFVATDSGGQVLARSPVFDEVAISLCSR